MQDGIMIAEEKGKQPTLKRITQKANTATVQRTRLFLCL